MKKELAHRTNLPKFESIRREPTRHTIQYVSSRTCSGCALGLTQSRSLRMPDVQNSPSWLLELPNKLLLEITVILKGNNQTIASMIRSSKRLRWIAEPFLYRLTRCGDPDHALGTDPSGEARICASHWQDQLVVRHGGWPVSQSRFDEHWRYPPGSLLGC